jgi:putative ABC transport system substrate-binding protein
MRPVYRRQFLLTAGMVLLTAPVLAQQPGRKYRVGMLIPVSEARISPYRAALAEQLAREGFVEGRNLELQARAALNSFHEDQQAARDLLKAKPDALFTCYTNVTLAAMSATKTTPIVFAWVAEPVATGIVKSLASPGGNATGVTNWFGQLLAKRIELSLELVPDAKRIGLLVVGVEASPLVAEGRKAAAARGVELLADAVQTDARAAVARMAKRGAQALIFLFPSFEAPVAAEIAIRAAREKRIPAIFEDVAAVENGALISLGTNERDDIGRGASLLAKVLRGARPARLPVDQPTRFELAVNLKTATAIGITVPNSILLRADRVIE